MLNKKQRDNLRVEARRMYSNGSTYNEITQILGSPKSTISGWCSDLAKIRLEQKLANTQLRKQISLENKKKLHKERTENRISIPCETPYSEYRMYYHKRSKDKRLRAHLVKYDGGVRDDKFMTYARYIMSVKLNRRLSCDETVDHIDEDKTNDNVYNLQILSMEDNISKTLRHKYPNFDDPRLCVVCENEIFSTNRRKRTCSKDCKTKLILMNR